MNSHNHNRNNHNEQDIIYTCPMHPEVGRDKPGMCPECGMNLVPASASADAKALADKEATAGRPARMICKKNPLQL